MQAWSIWAETEEGKAELEYSFLGQGKRDSVGAVLLELCGIRDLTLILKAHWVPTSMPCRSTGMCIDGQSVDQLRLFAKGFADLQMTNEHETTAIKAAAEIKEIDEVAEISEQIKLLRGEFGDSHAIAKTPIHSLYSIATRLGLGADRQYLNAPMLRVAICTALGFHVAEDDVDNLAKQRVVAQENYQLQKVRANLKKRGGSFAQTLSAPPTDVEVGVKFVCVAQMTSQLHSDQLQSEPPSEAYRLAHTKMMNSANAFVQATQKSIRALLAQMKERYGD